MIPRSNFRNRFVLLFDVLLIILSVLGSFALRLDAGQISFYLPAIAIMSGVSLLVKIPTYYFFGLYRRLWLYASTNELRLITIAVSSASILTSGIMSLILLVANSRDLVLGMPRSALGIDWLLSLVLIGGSRFAMRLLGEQSRARSNKGRRALIVGAGDAGALVVRELQKSSQLDLTPIGFLDDDPAKQQHEIYGVTVIGKVTDLSAILEDQQVDEVIFAIPSAPGNIIRSVHDACRRKGIPSRTMPGIYELIGGKVSVNRLREVDITDLLRRDHVRINDEKVGETLKDKRVLVTGAGGSIGSELSRQIARRNPAQLILLGHGENSIFEILLELQSNYPDLKLIPIIADIRNGPRLDSIFNTHQPQIVFHAAAHKHVPLMEANPIEAITNNVLGTRNIVLAALRHNTERFVLISTDKAVRPSSIYGATKRFAEMIVLDAAREHSRAFTVVRFGNVLGSRGSIIPTFKNQIANGGPITITHPDMTRFFMTIPEAVYLVLQASSMQNGSEVFVLNMGQPVRILDLAEDLIKLSGLEPNKDIDIIFTGIRPGEKISEELWDEGTALTQTAHPDIFRLDQQPSSLIPDLPQAIEQLIALGLSTDRNALNKYIDSLIPGSVTSETIHSDRQLSTLDL